MKLRRNIGTMVLALGLGCAASHAAELAEYVCRGRVARFADMNEDGREDALGAYNTSEGSTMLYFTNADFYRETALAVNMRNPQIVVADVDADGDLDGIVTETVCDPQGLDPVLLLNDGAGNFTQVYR